jgi:hypothetical protein
MVLIPSSITKICHGFLLALFVSAISLINNVLDYCSDTILHVVGINPVSFDFNRISKRQGQSGLSLRSFFFFE